MMTIPCNHPCVYANDGLCTLTHATSITATTEKSCAYFKDRTQPSLQGTINPAGSIRE